MSDGEWFTGPKGSRRKYRVRNTTALPGGRGFVFPAEQAEDGLAVGLKIIEEDDAFTASRVESAYATLRRHPHPNLLEPLSLFLGPGLFKGGNDDPPDSDSDLLYLAYHWIEGNTLRAAAPLDPPAAAQLARDLSAAIAHLHGVCWLIHRDIHPGNIIIGDDGRASLIDIDAWVEVGETRAVPASGVLGFLPPERSKARWDQRSDVWALGMVMTYALLGHPTGTATTHEVAVELARVLPRGTDAARAAALIGELTHTDPEARRTDLAAWADEFATVITARPQRRVLPWVLGAAGAVAVAVAVSGVALGWWSDEPDDPAPAADTGGPEAELLLDQMSLEVQAPSSSVDGECAIAVGQPGADLALHHVDEIERWSGDLTAAAPDSCGVGHAEVYGQAVFQLIEVDGSEVVLLASEHGVVRMHPVQMSSYEQLAGRGSDLNVQLGGYPVEVLGPRSGVESIVRLSEGGLIVGRRLDTQAFWMPDPVLAMWEVMGGVEGELGLPMTNPYSIAGALRQDFEGGYMVLPVTSPLPWDSLTGDGLEVFFAEPGPLPDVGTRGGILRQPNGTAWWYTGQVRRWIPDGGVWSCLGGHDAVVVHDVDGPTLAQVELGPPATCMPSP